MKINAGKDYFSFTKNHPTKMSMGGLATAVHKYIKKTAVKVQENSEVDEFLIVRLEHVKPALNKVSIYGQQEGRNGREGREDILKSWERIKKELLLIQRRGEAVVICGDLNRAVGADELGVRGNKERVSYGGRLVRELLADGEYVLLNNLQQAQGGPWTRVDPADGNVSCLDLAIVSVNILPCVVGFIVDSERKFTPRRVSYKKKG